MREVTFIPDTEENSTGVVATVHRAEGDTVEEGTVLFDVDLDKVTVEIVAPVAGILAAVLVQEEDEVDVGEVLARIDAR